jgi:hypothetical protein
LNHFLDLVRKGVTKMKKLTSLALFIIITYYLLCLVFPATEERLPPALATTNGRVRSPEGGLDTIIELFDLLGELFAKIGELDTEMHNAAWESTPNKFKYIVGICSSVKWLLAVIGVVAVNAISKARTVLMTI